MTYSIVAREPLSGRLGAAVQSCVFAVGTRVPFARAAVGAVAVQAASEITWGPVALDMLEQGLKAGEVIDALIERGPVSGAQFAVVDSTGAVAAFTSAAAAAAAGQAIGDGVSCQANPHGEKHCLGFDAACLKNSAASYVSTWKSDPRRLARAGP